jgi:hypothetical protein
LVRWGWESPFAPPDIGGVDKRGRLTIIEWINRRSDVSLHFWAPEIDPSHPMDCTQPERYALQRLTSRLYLAIRPEDQSLEDVEDLQSAYFFHTHEAALRAAVELNKLSVDRVDVVKID